ncbi:Biotin carboxyl carrier protein of acetyl-CoA carboxylase [Lactiplantibacillus plantarum]|uniref:acetyl-CoA carboxylase biotin carboxyl carrier protein n=1 Tax=Lactiplantibacillus plantarum TaxID=1590 RepID=UPI000CF9C7A6|nr:biotin/lipoyl-containing protein [Lactiplantibacillus plantarum]SPE08886.1 Biotin carboxyl carrier protein of acetyl-CoA carboxylase [Lactiplantibacillus plantarum]SPE13442.1 Biotin carboxyl carrier protein of acetyl-CoA carboxylase [Lactiplantibacillus plantarum]SPH07549.1 Biotin carboxyl carrier protein of acetyl-CoA carboxylase [Lactiplantibacillus plantarum]SPH10675.1 Biotin carboxyl carrier protein of acetyl-CoA carboxylase [Lactiplantibacillus plantarum]
MNLDEIKAVMALMKQNDVTEFEYENDEQRYKLKRGSTQGVPTTQLVAPVEEAVAPVADEPTTINATMVGIFYEAPSPDEKAFVKVGDQVEKGQTIGVIEAMKMMNDVVADHAGKITKVLVANEENVEFDQPLFEIEID